MFQSLRNLNNPSIHLSWTWQLIMTLMSLNLGWESKSCHEIEFNINKYLKMSRHYRMWNENWIGNLLFPYNSHLSKLFGGSSQTCGDGGTGTESVNPSPQLRVKKSFCFPFPGSFSTAGRFCEELRHRAREDVAPEGDPEGAVADKVDLGGDGDWLISRFSLSFPNTLFFSLGFL